ncbi:hypothetical protein MNEG_14734 [Monoraphidium neglectum]|uniref:MAGE domain-containing protein n=1 Tax=Monoraphidium neglectum TaxID=145388 RepID=A0A0D2MDE1_9CHLO|nr:hypothetical protein MNEG_14734 [Monoraphidium neglectum]KIY93230.1 hypothetical protein MNEG_14734 [Monoraphidium neglectum]|eukprot:XP_013892250.1 hypothetical protein MNEG_14734 [Monoraphidium neglectum]
MLFKQHEKPDVPVKRQELLEACFGDYKKHKASKKLPSLVIRVAQGRIISILGIEMQEIARGAAATRKRGLAQDDGPSSTQTYILRSVLPLEMRRQLVDNRADDQPVGFMMVVLSLIHSNGGTMELEELWRHLKQLGVAAGDVEHPQFGKSEDMLKELEKTRFIIRSQQHDTAGVKTLLQWGERAVSELGTAAIQRWTEEEFARAPGYGDTQIGGGGRAGGGAS